VARWLAWHGHPLAIEELISRVSRPDEYVVGWYGQDVHPTLGHGDGTESKLFIAQAGSTPLRHGRWLFAGDVAITRFDELGHELIAAVDPGLLAAFGGATAAEALFCLALTFGLADDPAASLERAIGFAGSLATRHGAQIAAAIGVSDGETLWALRYASQPPPPPLFASADVQAARMLYPNRPLIQQLRDDDHIIASERLADLPGAWDALPESSLLVVRGGRSEGQMFRPEHSWEPGAPVGH
jgi:predicted glutamine amidotransferase